MVNINLKPLFGTSLELLTCMTVVCNPAAVRGHVVALSFPSCVHRCTSAVAPPCRRPICLCALLVLCVMHNTLVRNEPMRTRLIQFVEDAPGVARVCHRCQHKGLSFKSLRFWSNRAVRFGKFVYL